VNIDVCITLSVYNRVEIKKTQMIAEPVNRRAVRGRCWLKNHPTLSYLILSYIVIIITVVTQN